MSSEDSATYRKNRNSSLLFSTIAGNNLWFNFLDFQLLLLIVSNKNLDFKLNAKKYLTRRHNFFPVGLTLYLRIVTYLFLADFIPLNTMSLLRSICFSDEIV